MSWEFIIGTVIGLAGLAFGWWSYERTKTVKQLAYAQTRRALVRREIFHLQKDRKVAINGIEVSHLNRDYILFAASGNASIKFSDHINHARLEVAGARIFDAGVVRTDDPNNGASATIADGHVEFRFDYLRSRDAVLFYVDHDSDEADKVKVSISERERDIVRRSSFHTINSMGSRAPVFATAFVLLLMSWVAILQFPLLDTWVPRDGSFQSITLLVLLVLIPVLPIAGIAWFIASVFRPGSLMSGSPTLESVLWLEIWGDHDLDRALSTRKGYR